jgi:predicted DNA-binding protein YlxM (UPF0122 family)
MDIGSMIRQKMVAKDISVQELAEKLGRSRVAVSEMIRKQAMSVTMVENVSDILKENLFEEIADAYNRERGISSDSDYAKFRLLMDRYKSEHHETK